MNFTCNPLLETLKLPFDWNGTPIDDDGRFVNLEIPFNESFKDLIKWQTTRNPQKEEKKNDSWRLDVDFESGFLESGADCIVWLGHASFFIRISGISMLIDPVFFNIPLIRRFSPLPVLPQQIRNLDYILISHDHRDHCDEKSIRLLSKNNSDAVWLTGLNMEKLLTDFAGHREIQAAGWYQQYKTDSDVKISYVPSRHWGKRSFNDTNLHLWGGFVIQCAGKTVYFAGDSGFDNHFKNVGKIFPDIDFAMIGIGAYKPEFFMAQSHTSPKDAVRGFYDTQAKVMIPMHYGTFDLADEPIGDPLRVLKTIASKDITDGKIRPLKPGQMLAL